MIYKTVVHRAFNCPIWNTKIYIDGHYRLPEDSEPKGPATFMFGECLIAKSKPGNKEYNGMICNRSECDYFNIFPRLLEYPYE